MHQRAVITGIAGFAGGALAEHLLVMGDEVLGCSREGAWSRHTPSHVRNAVELLAWDVSADDGLPRGARLRIERFRPDVVYHLAALSTPKLCGGEQPSGLAIDVNVEGTRRVLNLAISLSSQPRVLFTSTSRVYGRVDRDNPVVDESAPLEPSNGYGHTKLGAETEICRAADLHGCEAVIARAFQHTGPRQAATMMLPEWCQQYAERRPTVTVHTRDAVIDLTDVRDVVRAYRQLAVQTRPREVYNVGSGVPRRSGDVLDVLRAMADRDVPIVESRPGFKQDPIADISALQADTGWRPAIPLEQTVADTLAWWREEGSR